MLVSILGVVMMSAAGFAIGHSGNTDSNGCHTDHKTGDYHCHKPK
jgi:hypothetical protein